VAAIGRTVVVTGGGTGIGAAFARRFAADGCTVVIVGRRADVLAQAAESIRADAPGVAVHCETADVAQPDDVQDLVARMAARVDQVEFSSTMQGRRPRPTVRTCEGRPTVGLRPTG